MFTASRKGHLDVVRLLLNSKEGGKHNFIFFSKASPLVKITRVGLLFYLLVLKYLLIDWTKISYYKGVDLIIRITVQSFIFRHQTLQIKYLVKTFYYKKLTLYL